MLSEYIQELFDKEDVGSEKWNALLGLRIHASLIDKWMTEYGTEKFIEEQKHILKELDIINRM